jgi:aspartate/methionine/tyrosine aminotransferase
MFQLHSFALEDFFRQYEHRQGLLNLASSDALPWTMKEVTARCAGLQPDLSRLNLNYPDIDGVLSPGLEGFCKPLSGMGVLATSGTAEAILLVLAEQRCRTDNRPRIAIPLPSYGAYEGISNLLGFEIATYSYRPDSDWSVDDQGLREISAQSDIVVVNNPHNPTGHLIDEGLLKEIGETVAGKGGTLLVDEVFRLPEDCESASRLGPHVIVIGSLSKVYGMPGLRLGWIVADKARLDQLRTLQQYTTLSLNSFAVMLGSALFEQIESFSQGKLLQTNRGIVRQWAATHTEVLRVLASSAGTTAVMEIKSSPNEDTLFDSFLEKQVLLVPGFRCFAVKGPMPWFRLGYGGREEVLRQGLHAVSEALTHR